MGMDLPHMIPIQRNHPFFFFFFLLLLLLLPSSSGVKVISGLWGLCTLILQGTPIQAV